jgi:hypothetical protein
MISSFVEGDECFLFADRFVARWQQGLGLAIQDERAGCEEFLFMTFERPIEHGMIDFEAMGLRVDDFVKQLAIVC